MKRFVIAFLLLPLAGGAQEILENNPPSIRWYQVRTPNFNVLFPGGFERQAQRVANTLEHIREAESSSMGNPPRRISVLLQNQSAISNGFVSMFPPRSEFYTMPSQNYNFVGNNDWLDMLAAHEYRHIVQYAHANRGFNRLVFFLFGYPTLSGMAHAAAPDWFWEGDAVVTETAFTPAGRGRIPNFNLLFRTNLLEGRTFNYHKQYLRSYKHNIPNHYVLGYNMVSWLRRHTNDPDIWEKISARSWSVPFIPFAFSNAIRRETGMGVSKLYRTMAAELRTEWAAAIDTAALTEFETVNTRRGRAYTDYLYPQPQRDGSVIALKEGIGDIQRFVRLSGGREERLFTPGFVNETGMLSAVNETVVWNEFGFDPRWRVRTYSLLKAYDAGRGKVRVIGDRHSRYASAALSPDGKHVVTVRSTTEYEHRVVILAYPGGEVVREFDNPANHFYSMPRWSGTGDRIVVLRTEAGGKAVTILDPASGRSTDVLPVSDENVGHPVLHNDYLLFNSPVTGIDNVYAIHLPSGKRFQVTRSRYGAYNPSVAPDGAYLYYNEQGRNGLDVVRIRWQPGEWKPFTTVGPAEEEVRHLVEQEGRPDLFATIPQVSYPVARYRRARHLINPFSWGVFTTSDLAQVDIGITSRDLLSTTSVTAGYTLDINERTGYWRAGLSYQGWFPVIDVNFTQGNRSVNEGRGRTVIINGDDTTRVVNDILFEWQEQNISAGLRIPLITTRSKMNSGVTLESNVGVTRVRRFTSPFTNSREFPTVIRNGVIQNSATFLDYIGSGTLAYNHTGISAYRMLKQSPRDIYSRWGQTLRALLYSLPFGGNYSGRLASAVASLYFPGIGKHHSINGYAAWQHSLVNNDLENLYLFRNTVPVPRGHSVSRFKTYYSASVNYTLPLWYPDVALGPVLNIQRVRLNVFADHALGRSPGVTIFRLDRQSYTSVGGELIFDFNVMRFLPQIDLGVRYSYGISPATTEIELVVGTINF